MPQDVSSLEYEVITELIWENGQVAMHGLGGPRVAYINKPTAPSTWEKPRSGGTLESIVNQATCHPLQQPPCNDFLQCFQLHQHHQRTMLVPREKKNNFGFGTSHDHEREQSRLGSSCSSFSRKSWEMELGGPGFTSTSPENTISGQECNIKTSTDDGDSISYHSRSHASDRKADEEEVVGKKRRKGKFSVSTKSKRSRDSEIHNQSERKRRERINERMKTLQQMLPRSCTKSDKVSMLDEVIEYMKQLQAQVKLMTKELNTALPMQMSMMRGDCPVMPDPRPPLLPCQSGQPILITMDAYNKLEAKYRPAISTTTKFKKLKRS